MGRVMHFEFPADNPERAVEFYKQVFGWQFQKWEGPMQYWLVSTGAKELPGIDGGMMLRQHPGQGTVNTIGVPSVDAAIATVEKNGGKVVAPKMPIPGVGYFAYCADTEGNQFGIMQADPAAH
jgi:predicted enzyme related to lactoylglutathione lyase